MKHSTHITLLRTVYVLAGLLYVFSARSQGVVSGAEEKPIRWVGLLPLADTIAEKATLLKKLGNLVFGKREEAALLRPVALLANHRGAHWVLDQGNRFVIKMEQQTGKTTALRDRKFDEFESLVGICRLPDGEVLFTDSRQDKVFLLDPEKNRIRIFSDTTRLRQPTGVAFHTDNKEIWVVETHGHSIAVFDEQGNFLRRFGKRGAGKGEFNFPTSIWIDKEGRVYIVDAMNFRVQVLNARGETVTMFGKQGDATGYFSMPKGIATDSYGNIYVVDVLFHTVQIFDPAGNFLYNFGEQGRGDGQFWMPSGIYIDEKDFIYIADSYNARVQIFKLVNGG